MTTDRHATAPATRLARAGWGLMALVALAIAAYSVPAYLHLDPDLSRIPLNPSFPTHLVSLSLHALPGSIALALGPFQFVSSIRARWPRLHRVAGRAYLVCVGVASLMGVIAAAMSTSEPAARIGFVLLATAWAYSGAAAYRAACEKRFAAHRIWMIRNYALTFSAVVLRVFLAGGLAYREANPAVTFDQAYTASVWASIFVCHVVAEWFLAKADARPARPVLLDSDAA